jgi:hypothetical protein
MRENSVCKSRVKNFRIFSDERESRKIRSDVRHVTTDTEWRSGSGQLASARANELHQNSAAGGEDAMSSFSHWASWGEEMVSLYRASTHAAK